MQYHSLAQSARRHRVSIIFCFWLCIIGTPLTLAESTPSQSIQGCVITGGTNTNVTQTCNFNPRFGLTPEVMKSIVAAVPRENPVFLQVIGGNKDQRMGDDLQRALVGAGLQVRRMSIGVMSPPPDEPLTIDTRGRQTTITLFPAA